VDPRLSLSLRSPLIVSLPAEGSNVLELIGAGESYEYKKLDISNADDKAYFEGAMAWDLVVDGKEWADGKNFK
jgi:elongation factor 1-gamma